MKEKNSASLSGFSLDILVNFISFLVVVYFYFCYCILQQLENFPQGKGKEKERFGVLLLNGSPCVSINPSTFRYVCESAIFLPFSDYCRKRKFCIKT